MVTMSAESGDATYSFRAGDSLESAFNADAIPGDTLYSGRNLSQATRVGGHAVYVDIGSNQIGLPWALESVRSVIDVKQSLEAMRRR
jgi:hypothetical protein